MEVQHGHYVKMSYEQLPRELQETVDANNEGPESTLMHTRSNTVFGSNISQYQRQSSTGLQLGTIQNYSLNHRQTIQANPSTKVTLGMRQKSLSTIDATANKALQYRKQSFANRARAGKQSVQLKMKSKN